MRGCLQRVYWRSETWGEDAEGPPLTVTRHLIFRQEQQSNLICEMLNWLFDGTVAGAVGVATCIQAAVCRHLVHGSLDRLRVLYPNAAALGLTATRVYGDSREPNKNIYSAAARRACPPSQRKC